MRAVCFSDQKNYKDAIADCLGAVQLEPTNGRFHRALADAYRDAGKLADALNAYNKGLELLPKDMYFIKVEFLTSLV
jgi:Flp pilus assembly protein TadD